MHRYLRTSLAALAIPFSVLPAASAAAAPATADVVVLLRPGGNVPAVAAEHARRFGGTVSDTYAHALSGYAARMPAASLRGLANDPRVLSVSPDTTFTAAAAGQTLPAGVDRVDADLSSARAGDGSGSVGVNVAVIDGGIDPTHPDLTVAGGVDCRFSQTSPGAADNHGTHVAGTIGARDDGQGVVGVAPGARLWSVRVLDKHGAGALRNILCGVDWVTATRSDADPANDIAVANLSLGGKGGDTASCATTRDPLHRAVCGATAAGVTVVAAAMNSSVPLEGVAPASFPEVLTVTAMADFDGLPGGLAPACTVDPAQADDTAVGFSNYATTAAARLHTIAAPGMCVTSTTVGGYGTMSGTSMATPHVAGTVALCIWSGACAGMSPAAIINKVIADASAHATAANGFAGDPFHPVSGKYYGPLVWAGGY